MRKMRFSVRLAKNSREVAMADTKDDAEMAIATLLDDGGKASDFEVFDNAAGYRQARVVTTDGADFVAYIIEDESDKSDCLIGVDDPFTKEADQVRLALCEDGIAYEFDETADTFTRPLGTWVPMWVYAGAAR